MMMKVLFCKPLIPICVPFVVATISMANRTNYFTHEMSEFIATFGLLLFLNYCILREEADKA